MSFDQALALTVSPAVEGGLSMVRDDDGNWTGGKVGAGQLQGTKNGISAAFLWGLPATDPFYRRNPSTLTAAEVSTIYRAHFWNTVNGDQLPPSVAGLLFDAAVNQGGSWAPRCLQSALGVKIDGDLGPETMAAASAAPVAALHAEIARLRDARYRQDPDWPVDQVGWSRRLFTVVAATASFT